MFECCIKDRDVGKEGLVRKGISIPQGPWRTPLLYLMRARTLLLDICKTFPQTVQEQLSAPTDPLPRKETVQVPTFPRRLGSLFYWGEGADGELPPGPRQQQVGLTGTVLLEDREGERTEQRQVTVSDAGVHA